MNENPQKGTQTDIFNVSSSVSESESMKSPQETIKHQIEEEAQSNSVSSKEPERTEEGEALPEQQSVMRRLYNTLFEEVEVELPISKQPSSSSETPLPNKKDDSPYHQTHRRREEVQRAEAIYYQ